MMLRFRLALIGCFCSILSLAQENDSSIFIKYSFTFDQLLPSPFFPFENEIPDSSSLEVFNGSLNGKAMKKSVTSERIAVDLGRMETVGTYQYKWDTQGRLTRYATCFGLDTAIQKEVKIQYLIGRKSSEVYVRSGDMRTLDTLSFGYNRSGWVGNWRRHSITSDSSFIILGNKMYNGKGQMIIASNMKYGTLDGTYFYEYNTLGRLTRRAFATSAGIVLCTDTLEYEFLNDASSILKITHRLKVSGSLKWTLLEEVTQNLEFGRTAYSDYNDADDNYLYRNYVQYKVQYNYDDWGRVTDEYFGSIIAPEAIRVKYYYGLFTQPDSIVYQEQVVTKKDSYYRVYQRDVRRYDDRTKLILQRDISTILYEEQKKRDKTAPIEIVHIAYDWK